MQNRYIRNITSSFPYPVAQVFVKLRTEECIDPGPLRLQYLLMTGEALTRFLGVVTLCKLRQYAETTEGEWPAAMTKSFSKQLCKPSWGTWLAVTREGLKFLSSRESSTLVQELSSFYFTPKGKASPAANALDQMLQIRNSLQHGRLEALLPSDHKKLCDEVGPLLDEALEALEFLLDYELKLATGIEVTKSRRTTATYVHRYKNLSGIASADNFEATREVLKEFWESSAVLLVGCESGEHINLDPFYIYEEEAGKAADIFYFNGMQNPGKVQFAACCRGGSFDSSSAARSDEYAEELSNILKLIGPEN